MRFHAIHKLILENNKVHVDISVASIDTGDSIRGYLYHGSNKSDLDTLSPGWPPYDGGLGWGLYLAEKEEAANYGNHVYRVFVDAKRAFRLDHHSIMDDDEISEELLAVLKAKNIDFNKWFSRWASDPEFDQPYGNNFYDIVDDGKVPNEFMIWLKHEDAKAASELASYLKKLPAMNKEVEIARKKENEDYQKKQSEVDNNQDRIRLTSDHIARWAKIQSDIRDKYDPGKSLDVWSDYWDKWPANNIPIVPMDSVLTGEQVRPFWFIIGNEIVGVFDKNTMEDIGSMVQKANYDALIVEGLRENSSFVGHEVLVFEELAPDQMDGQSI